MLQYLFDDDRLDRYLAGEALGIVQGEFVARSEESDDLQRGQGGNDAKGCSSGAGTDQV